MTIYVYDLNNVLVCLFSLCSATRSTPTQVAIAKWLGINQSTVSRYIKSGKESFSAEEQSICIELVFLIK
jgi:hypothetical protein